MSLIDASKLGLFQKPAVSIPSTHWHKNHKDRWTKTSKGQCLLPFNVFAALNFCKYHSASGLWTDTEVVMDMGDYKGPHVLPSWYEEVDSTDHDVIFNIKPKEMLEASELKLPHRIVRIHGSKWIDKPSKEFYELKPGEKAQFTVKLEPVSSRPYITIENKFVVVSLDSFKKKKRLTIEDILFACRALCRDDTRSYEAFNVISDRDGVLELKLMIDNWST